MEAPASLARPVRSLVDAHDRRANSLIITIFGDSVLPRGGNIWLGSLIALAAPLGISERLVRTGVYRLAREGWLEAQSKGRRAYYTLTESGRETFADADRRIYAPGAASWDGRWRLVQLLPQIAQGTRQTLRRELTWLGFGQITPTLLAHPSADDAIVKKLLDEHGVSEDVLVFRGETADFIADETVRAVAETAWSLAELNADYNRFIRTFRPLQDVPDTLCELSDMDAFALRTLLIHDYRRILLKDPQLPPDLLPVPWAGTAAGTLCGRTYRAVTARADAHVGALLESYDGTVPESSAAYYARFREAEDEPVAAD